MSTGTLPIIRLEVEGMRHTICHALSDHILRMDEQVQAAVENYCSPMNLQRVINESAHDAIDAAVKEEVRSFFSGTRPGRMAIRAAVQEKLDATYPDAD